MTAVIADADADISTTPPADDLATLKVVGVRHYGRWIASVIVAVLLAQLIHGAATNDALDWATFADYVFDQTILDAVVMTLKLTFLAALFGFAGGIVLAGCASRAAPCSEPSAGRTSGSSGRCH